MSKQTGLSASTAWYSIGNFFVRSVSFILIPLYTNLLSPEEYGNFALLLSLYSLASVLYQSNLQTGFTKYYLENENAKYRIKIFSTVFISVILFGFTLSLIAAVFSKNISALLLGNPGSYGLILILFGSLFVENIGYFALQLLKSKEQSRKVVIFTGVNAVINFLLNILFVYFLNLKVEGILLAQIISGTVMVLFMLPVILPELEFSIDRGYLWKIILFSLPLLVSGLLSSGIDVGDRFILNYFSGKSEVGIYSLSYKIALVMNVFVISFRTAWTPHGLRLYYKKDLAETFGLTLKKLLGIGLFIILTVTFFAPLLFKIRIMNFNFLSANYIGGLEILPLVLTGYLFSGLASLYSIYPMANNKSIHFLIADGLGFIINIVLNIFLIPRFGMLGAALATCAAFAAAAFYLIILSGRYINVNYPRKQIITVISTAAAAYIAGEIYPEIIVKLVLLLTYVVVIIFGANIKLKGFLTSQ